jgi:hypothetical protein
MENDIMSNQETITLKNAIDAYLAHLAENEAKETTIKVYKRVLDLALNHFGAEKKLTAIMVPHAGKFFKSQAVNFHPTGRPKASPTVKQIKRVFRQCLEFAKERGWIAVLPIPKLDLLHARGKKTAQEPKASKVSENTGD